MNPPVASTTPKQPTTATLTKRARKRTKIVATIGPASTDPESHLLQVATSWDVVGLRPEEFPPEVRTEVLGRYPRIGFGAEFAACFEDQAQRKPDSAAAASIANNGAQRIAANPLDD